MPPSPTNIDFAKENEEFANEIESGFENQPNWVVTVRFYSLVHYIEERLHSYGYDSESHVDRKNNIRRCKYIDNKVKKLYRRLEDVSRDARYECIRMEDEDVRMSQETLKEGKNILGFDETSSSHKYSTK